MPGSISTSHLQTGENVAAIDLGSHTVRCAVGRAVQNGVQIVAAGQAPSRGIVKGSVSDPEVAGETFKAALSLLGSHCPPPGSGVYVTVSAAALCLEPVDAYGTQLRRIYSSGPPAGDDLICYADEENLQLLRAAASAAGYQVKGFIPAPVAAAQAALSELEMAQGICLLDIGGAITSVTIYRGGTLTVCSVVPVGGHLFTSDITKVLQINTHDAERLKTTTGSCLPKTVPEDSLVTVQNPRGEGRLQIKQRAVAEVIEARTEDLLDLVCKPTACRDEFPLLTSGVVLIGGGSALRGLRDSVQLAWGIGQVESHSECAGWCTTVRMGRPERTAGGYNLRAPGEQCVVVGAVTLASREEQAARALAAEQSDRGAGKLTDLLKRIWHKQ